MTYLCVFIIGCYCWVILYYDLLCVFIIGCYRWVILYYDLPVCIYYRMLSLGNPVL